MEQIISDFQADNVDLMVGVATPVAMRMQSATEGTDTPVVFSAVSDPVGSGLVDSLEAPGANITGTSDYLDTSSIMKLIQAQNPDVKKIGLLYDVGQDSSTTAIQEAKDYLDEQGIEYVERTGTTTDEVQLAAEALIADGVDAVFTPTDNTIMTAELSIYEKFIEAGIPHYTGADSFALNGAFVGYGVDYANLGQKTADMIADILVDGAKPSDLNHPGHVFPLRARNGGVEERDGHTEANVDLMKLAGYKPMGVLCEVTNIDGTMARMPELEVISEKYALLGINVEKEEINQDSIDGTISSVKVTTLVNNIKKSNMTIDQMKLICDINKIDYTIEDEIL